uniref:[histone H4]-lysine(20) N-methyltransferase n=1 Tax=Acrobeloides nanus TaxID=290746 RepID=A0A914CMV9_9BILA
MLGNVVEQKNKGRRKSRKSNGDRKKNELSITNHKITEFFPVRRSNRKSAKEVEKEKLDELAKLIYTAGNEKYLGVHYFPEKGRGILSLKRFARNEFVVEYKGDLLDYNTAKRREQEYSRNAEVGSYMYFFKRNGQGYCIDATEETPYKGRLINHSILRPNLKTKVVELPNSFHLVLVAKRDIEIDEELLYDYGDRTPLTVAKNPWLLNS